MFSGLKPYDRYGAKPGRWIPAMPIHWRIVPGASVLRAVTAKNAKMVESTVLSLSYGRVIVKPAEKLRGLVPESFETYQVLEPGDIVIRPTDLQNDKTSLRVGHVRDHGIITSAYLGFRVKGIDDAFAFSYLAALDHMKIFYGMGSGLRQNLDLKDFKRLPLPIPPAEEQAAIVKYLWHAYKRIDRAIASKQKLTSLLLEQRQAIAHTAVTQGLSSATPLEETGDRWFPTLPKGSTVTMLGRVIDRAIDGPHYSPNYVDSGIPFLSARNIRRDRWDLSTQKFISKDDFKAFSRRVQPRIGDVLYTKGGTTGVARVVDLPYDFQVWVHVAVLKPRLRIVDPEYLALVLNSPQCYEQSQLATRGATNQDLGLSRMKRISLPLPATLADQCLIVREVRAATDALDRTVVKILREVELLREFRTRLTADVVTGQVDVRVSAAKLSERTETHCARRDEDGDAVEMETDE